MAGKLFDGVKDALREWWLVVRCSFIGVWVGIDAKDGGDLVTTLLLGFPQGVASSEFFRSVKAMNLS